jgi:hypothetical protein
MLRLSNLARAIGMASTFFISQSLCSTSNSKDFPFIEISQYNANNPIEDRYCYQKLNSINGFTASVFDGHGGDLTVFFYIFRQSMHQKT